MPWFAWYSLKQERLYGYAHYLNKQNEVVSVTEINQDPEYEHSWSDSVRIGRVTHFMGVQKRNHTKKLGKEEDKMYSKDMIYKNTIMEPSLILN